MQKHFGVTPDLEAIIDNRNRKEYRTESAFIAAAVRSFAAHGEQQSITEQLKQMLNDCHIKGEAVPLEHDNTDMKELLDKINQISEDQKIIYDEIVQLENSMREMRDQFRKYVNESRTSFETTSQKKRKAEEKPSDNFYGI